LFATIQQLSGGPVAEYIFVEMSDVKGLREISNDPFGKLLTALSKKFAACLAKDTAEAIENPEDIYSDGQDVESALKYHNFAMSKRFVLGTTQYYSPTEPDHDKVRVWLQGNNLGTEVNDISGYDNHASIQGDPILVLGDPFDYGIFDGALNPKSVALRFNAPPLSEHDEFLVIPHTMLTRASEGLSTGISFFIRFRAFDFAQQNGNDRTLYEKFDNVGITDGVQIQIGSGGRLEFHVKNTNVEYNVETVTPLSLNTVYDIWCTYTKAGNVLHIYVNGVDQTLQSSNPPQFHEDTSSLDATVCSIGLGTPAGNFYGDLYDFMLMRERVVTQTDVTRHYTNKWTTANIPFSQVLITNYSVSYGLINISKSQTLKWNVLAPGVTRISKSQTLKWNVTGSGAAVPSFTSASFTSGSFTQ